MAKFCENCGTQVSDDAKFCESCGAQTSASLAAIQAEQVENSKVDPEKSMKETIWITVALGIASVVLLIIFGVFALAAIAFFAVMVGIKWYFEIKAQRRWKEEAEERAKGEGGNVL